MEKLQAMFKATPAAVCKVAPAVAVLAFSGAAMAAGGTATGFDVTAFLDPVVTALKENISTIVTTVAGVFAIYWGATSGIQVVKKFLGKVTS